MVRHGQRMAVGPRNGMQTGIVILLDDAERTVEHLRFDNARASSLRRRMRDQPKSHPHRLAH